MAAHRAGHPVTKLAFALVIASFLLSTCVSILSLHMMSKRNIREMNMVLTTQVYDYITAEIARPIIAARTMASNSYLISELATEEKTDIEAASRDIGRYISGVERGLGYSRGFVVSGETLNYYTRDGLTRTIDLDSGEDEWYTKFVAGSSTFDLDVDFDEVNKADLTVFVNVKIHDLNRNFLGICGVGVRMGNIQDLFSTFEESFAVKIDLVDPSGIVQVDTDTASIESVDLSHMLVGANRTDYTYQELDDGRFAIAKYIEDLDWYLVVQSTKSGDMGQYANVIFLNVALCLLVLTLLFVALRVTRRHTQELTSASYVDHMTGLGNKRAFELDKEGIDSRAMNDDLVCVTADVNGLKRVNDSLGHEAGDELICGAADCLRVSLGRYGHVYRTGGDEFSALLHATADDVEEMKVELSRATEGWTGTRVSSLAVSVGFVGSWEHPSLDVDALMKISDERMYEEKERYYERAGTPRRG